IDLRASTEEIENLVDNKKYFSGYHMNKKHWLTIILDGSVPIEDIYNRIDSSYNLK
ncbi:MmcQ/YjbR family DNA-binding protein, partial [bacterium]|nr:MmcQ/YjbR family DNA-binding protein [bacterium]